MEKKKLIIFTTRNFDREDSHKLFSLKKIKEHNLKEIKKSSLLEHFNKNTIQNKSIDEQKKILLSKIDDGNILGEISRLIKHERLKVSYKALTVRINNNNDKGGRNMLLNKFIKKTLFKNKDQYILPKKTLDEAINELDSSNKNRPNFLELRNAIYQREDKNIYGYRCLELWNDFFDKSGRENFITALVEDVVKIHCKNMNDCISYFFNNYEIVLILHGEDVNYPKGQYKEDVDNTFLLKLNNGLKDNKKSIKTYVYQHTTNIFVDILNDYGKTNKTAEDIVIYLKNHFENRAAFEDIEKTILNGGKNKLKELKEILKKFEEAKIY